VRSGGAPDSEGLNVPVLAAIGVGGRAELDLEGDVFAKIAIRVEAKDVETFVAEGVGRADAGVRIHGQSHHRCARAAAKQVEVADVDAGVFFCGRRIEMMRHGESSPKGLDARPKGRSLGCGVDGAIILSWLGLRERLAPVETLLRDSGHTVLGLRPAYTSGWLAGTLGEIVILEDPN